MCCPQTHVPEGYAARGEAPGAPAVHVLRDGGVGDGLGGGLQAGLAAQATAVAAEAVQLPPRGIVGSDAPGLGVEGVVIVDVIVVSVPRRTRRLWLTMRDEGGSKAVGCWLLPGFSPQDPPYGHIHVSLFPQKHVPQPSLPQITQPRFQLHVHLLQAAHHADRVCTDTPDPASSCLVYSRGAETPSHLCPSPQ